MQELKILYLEDNPFDAGLTRHTLKRAGIPCNILMVETEQEYVKALSEFKPDLILSDHSLPGFNSTEACKLAQQMLPGIPFILLTGSISDHMSGDHMIGISDCILKSDVSRLPSSIERILSEKK